MRFQALGTLRLRTGAGWSEITAARPRAVLALLLIADGRAVPMDRLVDEVWGDEPPRTAKNTIQTYVVRLRRLLGGGEDCPLRTTDHGYALLTGPDEVDVAVFERAVTAARQRLDAGAPEDAAGLLTGALDLWRSPPFADVPVSRSIEAEVARLEQDRLAALEARLGADLELGRHAAAVSALRGLVVEHPLREHARAMLMLALYRCGRRAEALDCYREGRALLADELGLEPAPRLRDLERAILRDADWLTPDTAATPAKPPVPAQLPAPVHGFTGREAALAQLDALSARGAAGLVIGSVVGTAGVGKTALAVQWAHRVRDRFPDGQLHVNLRGHAAGPPLRPIEALSAFLPALGVPAKDVPVSEAAAAGLYRSLMASRRMLILLDNAADPGQVRPLLPGGPGSLVLVTSRAELTGLIARDGAARVRLDPLPPAESRALITTLLDGAGDEPDAVDDVARLCGGLPLALRIAAANVSTRPSGTGPTGTGPHRRIADYAARLRRDRLAGLVADGDPEAAVRSAFDLSYTALPAPARRMFRLIGAVPGPDLDVAAAAALAGVSWDEAGSLLGTLARAHLADEHVPGRYSAHDLLRHYAAERSAAEDAEPERSGALDRLHRHYVSGVDAAARVLYPDKLRLPPPVLPNADGVAHRADLGWLDAERPNLLAIIERAATVGPYPLGWWLVDGLRGYFDIRMRLVDWSAAARAGLRCAEAAGDRRAQAAIRLSRAGLCWKQADYGGATAEYERAAALSRADGWPDGEAAAVGNLGVVHQEQGALDAAVDCFTRALAINARTGWSPGRANGLSNLAEVYRQLGRLDEAESTLEEATAIFRRTGSRYGEIFSLGVLAAVHRDAGRHAAAHDLAHAATALARALGDQRQLAESLNTLATVDHERGRHAESIGHHEEALRLARDIRSGFTEAQALAGLAVAYRAAGDGERAAGAARDALDTARRAGSVPLELEALTALAAVHADHGRAAQAIADARRALRGFDRTGQRLGQVRSHLVLERALDHAGQPGQADDHRRRARLLLAGTGLATPR
ncbi:DNA-binding SARP family transcriptional activator [Catenuloplanes nepalensis]|uniref:DNA-binding SARP family transcriptional activator n=1 Tax=Catenuloplanes nepalensis TaxID=587533 RepID=A0ABT9MZD0_9ACTN|nr:BTAD domain-containing putative transcriptional regulator [Catenuloplanes nepalensis]MDP9796797.1 DNA-binding SARP family transcriptional activator [Catenuloplanes nepalensis]